MPEGTIFVEKRAHRRISIKLPVEYRVIDDPKELDSLGERKKLKEKATYCKDISVGGLFIVADQLFTIGSTLRLDISMREISTCISVFAEIIWANETGGGLKILAIKEDDKKTLKEFIEKIA